jgi:hypothetical protein
VEQVIKDAQYQKLTNPTTPPPDRVDDDTETVAGAEGKRAASSPTAAEKWRRIGAIARRAGADDHSPTRSAPSLNSDASASSDQHEAQAQKPVQSRDGQRGPAKMMDIQYFLEMVDQKHRYGSSLRKYHKYWNSQPTSQNFFYWLDHGEGRDVELEECDRARLEREQVRYLSREERQRYLVKIDEDGKLRWAKNGEKVWTRDDLFRDSMNGIVRVNDQSPGFKYNVRPKGADSDATSSNDEEGSGGSDEEDSDQEHEDEATDQENVHEDHTVRGAAKIKEVSAVTSLGRLNRAHKKKSSKWIYVSVLALLIIADADQGLF